MSYSKQGKGEGAAPKLRPKKDKNDGAIRMRLASPSYRAAVKSGKQEAVVKVASQARGFRVQKLVDYIARTDKEGQELALEDEGCALVAGPEQIAARCAEWAEDYERAKPGTKRPPRHATHIILSAGAHDSPAEQRKIMDAARELLHEKFGKRDYEYLAVMHTDTGRPHVHVVIKNKSRNPDTPKLRLNPPDLFELRTRFAAELQKRGIEQVATLRRDRSQAVAEIAQGIERAQKSHTHFEEQMRKASPSVDAFAQRRRAANTVKKMRQAIKEQTRAGSTERARLLEGVRELNKTLKTPRADLPKAIEATAAKLGKDVAKVHKHFQDLRADLASGAKKLSERAERIKTIKKIGDQVRRDIQTARRGIQLTMTDPAAKAAALKALKVHEADLLKSLRTAGRLGPQPITTKLGKDYGERFRYPNDKFNRSRSAGATAPGRISEMRDLSGLPVVSGAGRTQVLLSNDERSRMGDRQGQPDRGMRRPDAGDAGRRLEQRRQQDKGKDKGR